MLSSNNLNQSKIAEFDLKLGRPNSKLGIHFNLAARKFLVSEPYKPKEVSESER